MSEPFYIEQTRDADLVWKIYTDPAVKEFVTNDAWEAMGADVRRTHVNLIVNNPKNHCLLVTDGENIGGCFILDAKEEGAYEVHTLLLPGCRGGAAYAAGRQAMTLAMTLPGVKKLVSYCPDCNPRALLYAIRCGWHQAGVAAAAWIKNGVSFPMEIVEYTQEGTCH